MNNTTTSPAEAAATETTSVEQQLIAQASAGIPWLDGVE